MPITRTAFLLAASLTLAGSRPIFPDDINLVQRLTGVSSHSKAAKTSRGGTIPIPVPIPVGIWPIVVPMNETHTPRVVSRKHTPKPKFWTAKDDPAWQPSGSGERKKKKLKHFIFQCEDIKEEKQCAQSFEELGLYCMGWGGSHCLPRSGAKCSDITEEMVCRMVTTWGMSCAWSKKGCGPPH
mmetsp:Transcript_41238/g.95488  ORF Transcript_41238/g.95488 Transcript_41238/m.95488 type:complete len:183 (+) Transcript_41238:40-588(+)